MHTSHKEETEETSECENVYQHEAEEEEEGEGNIKESVRWATETTTHLRTLPPELLYRIAQQASFLPKRRVSQEGKKRKLDVRHEEASSFSAGQLRVRHNSYELPTLQQIKKKRRFSEAFLLTRVPGTLDGFEEWQRRQQHPCRPQQTTHATETETAGGREEANTCTQAQCRGSVDLTHMVSLLHIRQ